jgi:2-C-methyl-D-erythritol 4-phosphate cytidylyltransferase
VSGESKEKELNRAVGHGGPAAGSAHAILVAAGRGERLGRGLPKGRVVLDGVPMLLHSLRTLLAHPEVGDLVLLVPPEAAEIESVRELLAAHLNAESLARVTVLGGGEERSDSVRRGLAHLQERGATADDLVLIHDAARPLLSAGLVSRCLESIRRPWAASGQDPLPGLEGHDPMRRFAVGVVPGLPVRETLKLVYEERVVVTQPRENLWAVQTPQLFRLGPLARAHRQAVLYGVRVTDDAALLEWQGLPVRMIPGDPVNLKVTYPEDLDLAERLLRAESIMRTGGGKR